MNFNLEVKPSPSGGNVPIVPHPTCRRARRSTYFQKGHGASWQDCRRDHYCKKNLSRGGDDLSILDLTTIIEKDDLRLEELKET